MSEDLIFGSDEWFQELNNRVKFPNMFSIYYGSHKETNDNVLQSMIVDTKSDNPRNIKFGSISKTIGMALSPYRWALIDVYYIENASDYYSKLIELGKYWNVNFNSQR
ncbi:hypothetical protein MTP04_02470 [Lysinibacillus sp. PLM2]|nr:hypothetical protein MTP04_02470 [Lysinibacillus sp. PLM2]